MNGPQHYRAAELLTREAAKHGLGSAERLGLLAEAQVSATLAVAAATALQDDPQIGCYTATREAWFNVAGVNAEAVARG